MKYVVYSVVLLLGMAGSLHTQSQVIGRPATAIDTSRPINFTAERLRYKKIDSTHELQTAAGKAVFIDGRTTLYCDSAAYKKPENVIEAFGNVHINDADSVHAYSQYLIYYANEKKAVLTKKVRLTDGKATLTTEELEYYTDQKLGSYKNGGKVVSGSSVLTSREGTYFADMKDMYFKQDVQLRDPQYKLDTDSLLYNTETQIATFITKTYIEDSSKRTIVTSDGYYDMKNKTARFGKRPVIRDGKTVITGEEVAFDDNTGESFARGNAVFKDEEQGVAVIANDLKANKKKNSFLATQNPLLIIKQDKDSIYISADTLFSGRLTDYAGYRDTLMFRDSIKSVGALDPNDTTNRNRFFQGFHNVRIFTDSLQAVADSLFYSGADSVFRLYTNPILWANKSQITGDTIYLFTKNKKPERLYVFENALMINQAGENLYNQLKGNTINGYFKEGNIDYVRSKGSSESIYYAQDEDGAYVGVNRADADVIDMYFVAKELNKVVYRVNVKGTTSPFGQVNHEEMRLRNFKWLDKKRPKTKFELYEAPPKE